MGPGYHLRWLYQKLLQPIKVWLRWSPGISSTSEVPGLQTILIKCMGRQPVVALVNLQMSLREFKSLTERLTDIPVEQQRIYQEGVLRPPCGCCRVYENVHTLSHYDIREVRSRAILY